MIGTGPAQRAVYELIRGRNQIAAERERNKGAMGVSGGLDTLAGESPITARGNVAVAFDNMLTAFGSEGLRAAIPLMLGATDMFNSIGAFAQAHPTAILGISEGIAGLGAALVATGGVAILAEIGPAGWLIGGFVALGAALMTLSGYKDKMFADTPSMSWEKWWQELKILPNVRSWDEIKSDPLQLGAPPSSANDRQSFLGTINMDSQRVATIVFDRGARSASGPNVGSAYFDSSMGHTPIDYNYARA
jgi:hypothetical protein